MMEQGPTLQQLFGVGERAQQQWFTRAENAWSALKTMTELVMHRKLRAGAETLCNDVSAIIRNCHADPNDIREEPAFPLMVEKITKLLDDYLRTASMVSLSEPPSPKLTAALQLINEAHDAFTRLLERMKAVNDTEDFTLRTGMMSAIFQRFPPAEKKSPARPTP